MKNNKHHALWILLGSVLLTGCATTCGPGTVETGGGGWLFQSGGPFNKVCLPISPVSDCTDFQMVEEDGGGWRNERDGGGWRIDRDGGGWRIERDGSGWRRERDEPHHPADSGGELETIVYTAPGICRIGVPIPE